MGTLILARSSINRRLHSLGRYALRSSFLLCGDSCANARVFRQHRPAGTGKRHGGPRLILRLSSKLERPPRLGFRILDGMFVSRKVVDEPGGLPF